MGEQERKDAVAAVQGINAQYPSNHSYTVVKQEPIGAYVIYTVEFLGSRNEKYTNYAVGKNGKVLQAFFYLAEVIPFVDRRMSWGTLLREQYGLVVGSGVAILVIMGVVIMVASGRDVPGQLWSLLSAAGGFIFGTQSGQRQNSATQT